MAVLSDNTAIRGGSFESEGDPHGTFDINDEYISHTSIYLEVVTHLISSICYHEEMKVFIVSHNETRTLFLDFLRRYWPKTY